MDNVPEQVKMMNLFCQGCNEVFAIPSRRGRPPRFCQKCGGDPDTVDRTEIAKAEDSRDEARRKAEERIDRLEIMLRASGTHISQHREKYPWATQ